MIVNYLTKGGTKDLLTPFFVFHRLASYKDESDQFREIARLRYEVYCDECQYLEAADYGDGLETDDLDDRSVHIAAKSLDNLIAGTVRLVLANESQAFPFEEHCSVFPDFKFPPRNECGEVSRLIVKKSFRRRPGDSMEGVSKEFQDKGSAKDLSPQAPQAKGKNRRNTSPQIMLGMYREMYRYSCQNGVRYWYAAMEKGLARLLDRMGFHFIPVGPETDYYGPVTTYIADLRQVEVDLGRANDLALAWFQDRPISDWMLITSLIKLKFGRTGK